MENGISIGAGVLWVLIWFGFMLLYTFVDIAIWRKIAPAKEKYLNILSIVFCMTAFLILLKTKSPFQIDIFKRPSLQGIILALGCAPLLYVLLDQCLDPLFEKIFPTSEESYQETLQSLSKAPIISLLQVCVLAPILEEILMRGFLLNGLSINYGQVIALIISSFLFALLHFNMVQTLSALICGFILGLLYLYTDSVICSIITHMGYNFISYITMILPLVQKCRKNTVF